MDGGHAKPKQHSSILDLLRRHGNKEERAHEAGPVKPPVAREVRKAEALDLVPFATDPVHLKGGLTLLKGKASAITTDAPTTFAHSDLVAGQYEGGFKLWECSVDLIEAVRKEMQDGHLSFRGKDVLELGCGHGLPGIFACVKGAASVHFQDFNESVLINLTIPNLQANLAAADAEQDPDHCPSKHGKGSTPGIPELIMGRGRGSAPVPVGSPGAEGRGAPARPRTPKCPHPTLRTKFVAGDWGDMTGLLSLAEQKGVTVPKEEPRGVTVSTGEHRGSASGGVGSQERSGAGAGAADVRPSGRDEDGTPQAHRAQEALERSNAGQGGTTPVTRDGHISNAAADVAPLRDAPGGALQEEQASASSQPTHPSSLEQPGPINSTASNSTVVNSAVTSSSVSSSSVSRTGTGSKVRARDERARSPLAYHKVLEGSPAFTGKGEEFLKGPRKSGSGSEGATEAEGGYDIILTSETVYSIANIPKLLELVKKCLRHPYGVLYLAGKKYYFGVGGGTRKFVDAVKEDGTLHGHLLAEIADGASNVREVWKFFYKP